MRHSADPTIGFLHNLYEAYNTRRFIDSDPVQFLHRFDDPGDQEVVGLVASGLAYGRVASIHASVEEFLRRVEYSPSQFADGTSRSRKLRSLDGFRHRWTPASDVVDLLEGVKRVRREKGCLQEAVMEHLREEHLSVREAASGFVRALAKDGASKNSLLADPASGSACKRLFLFFRWLARKDEVDLGIWSRLPVSKLVVPVDVHMHRAGQALGFTKRKQADLKAAMEITRGFKRLNSDDPLRFDFALTRPGILGSIDLRDVLGRGSGEIKRLAKVLPVLE